MSYQITYLFGAGASFGVLPVVDEIPSRLKSLIKSIESYKSSSDNLERLLISKEQFIVEDKSYDKREYVKLLIGDIKDLIPVIEGHASIDTYAKKLYLKSFFDPDSGKRLYRLKTLISLCFLMIQRQGKPNAESSENNIYGKEKRYDSFFASILSSIDKFPSNVKILSWNYDHQFEIAYSGYLGNPSFDEINQKLRISTKGYNNQIENEFQDTFSNQTERLRWVLHRK